MDVVYARSRDRPALRPGRQPRAFETPAPILSAAGGVVLVGDMAGNAYALDAESGEEPWSEDLGAAAIAGGVISYEADGRQRMRSPQG